MFFHLDFLEGQNEMELEALFLIKLNQNLINYFVVLELINYQGALVIELQLCNLLFIF